MTQITKTRVKIMIPTWPLITGKERLLIWRKAQGVWQQRKPGNISKQLRDLRRSWDRKVI